MDFVQCTTCKYLSKREARFFDLQLTVRNEFDRIFNSSVEEALKNFLNVDKLDGDNKYACPECNDKQTDVC